MEDHKAIRTIYLCVDNDEAGETACIHLNKEIPLDKSAYRVKPPVKNWNELLLQREQFDLKDWYVLQNLREKNDAGEFVPIIRMSDMEQTEVAFLWKPCNNLRA